MNCDQHITALSARESQTMYIYQPHSQYLLSFFLFISNRADHLLNQNSNNSIMANLEDPPGAPPRIDAGRGHTWQPIWEMTDNFWRGSLHHIWQPYNNTWTGRQPGFFRTENVTVTNDRMILRAQEDQPENQRPELRQRLYQNNHAIHARNATRPYNRHEPLYRDFSTSFVRTAHRQKYGFFEMYCKLADCDISSAFWLAYNEENRSRPGSWWTEIDVFEYSTSRQKTDNNGRLIMQESMINTNTHVHRFGNNLSRGILSRPGIKYAKEDLSKRPHKFGLDWTKDYIRWYFDDELIREDRNDYFHREMHLQLDRETFPNWFGLPRTGGSHLNNLPNNFEIYWVRSWKRYVYLRSFSFFTFSFLTSCLLTLLIFTLFNMTYC